MKLVFIGYISGPFGINGEVKIQYEAIREEASYDDIQDILEYNLSLEPDYLDYFL